VFLKAKVFIKATKHGILFVIYTTSACNEATITLIILNQYKEFQDVFQKKNVDILSKHRAYDYAIDLQDGVQPPFCLIYDLFQYELVALKEYNEKNLAKNFIEHSKLAIGVPILVI